jgi:GNAT superfamily N-acetyltransferase
MALEIRSLARGELSFCLDLAAAEGWNPGVYDAAPFFAADPNGFLVAELDGERIGCVSAVRYDAFGFIGFFIVRPEWRGKGLGAELFDAALERLRGVPIGLDGVVAQKTRYEHSGFVYSYANVRYRADVLAPRDLFASAISLERLRVLDDDVLAYDRACFGASRRDFLQAWVAQPDVVALLARSLHDGTIVGYGVGRECRDGTKIGPLFTKRLDVAWILYESIASRTPPPWYLDVPAPNVAAVGFANARGMTPVFETARMWCGATPHFDLEKVFGVTSFELG